MIDYAKVRHYLVDYAARCQAEFNGLADQSSPDAKRLRDEIDQANRIEAAFATRGKGAVEPAREFIDRRKKALEA
jgi:hypothetical protein